MIDRISDPLPVARPTPRWVHAWAVFTTAVTAVLLALGGLVTTFRVGMADPVWPTEPWYLFFIDWREPDRGFLIEHAHRLAGFSVGVIVSVLALGLWAGTTRGGIRWVGAAGLIVLLGGFGQFHRELMTQVDAPSVTLPAQAVGTMGVGLLVVVACGLASVRSAGLKLRLLGVLALLAVMMQGLLGGFRVRLNELVGTDLAAVHGIFAQLVFSLFITVAVLTVPASEPVSVTRRERRRVILFGVVLTAMLVLQLIWGAWVRHAPNGIVQRLHFLTAFVVVAVAVAMVRAAETPAARRRLRPVIGLLHGLIFLQVILGVDAWMGKFGTGIPIDLDEVTVGKAVVRTLHMLVGTAVLATSVTYGLVAARNTRSASADDAGTAVGERLLAVGGRA